MMSGFTGTQLKEKAIKEAQSGSGTKYDPRVVEVFVELIQEEERAWE